VRIVSNGLKRGQAALNCGQSGPEARNNHIEATRVGYHGFVLWYPTPFFISEKVKKILM